MPNPEGVKAIDPCCGIGTVVVEALSMGINIVGRDISPLVAIGARKYAHFGFEGTITKALELRRCIIDMPYDLFTHATPENQLSILSSARRIAKSSRCHNGNDGRHDP